MKAPACRFCESANVIKAGLRYNRNGKRQRFRCKSCGRRFTVDDGFLHMWYGKRIVSEAVDLHYEGLSCRAVASHFERHARDHPSWTSIWRWIHRFARFVRGVLKKLALKLSNRWQADEMSLELNFLYKSSRTLSYIFENNVRMKL